MGKKQKKTPKSYYIIGVLVLILVAVLLQLKFDVPPETLMVGYTDESSRFIEIDDLTIHYRDEGTGDPLILLHGAASSLHTWDGWARELKNDYRIIRPDLPAFGLTGPHPGNEHQYDLTFYTEFLNKFLEALQIEECYLAGNSLGGGIAWLYASSHPEQIRKAILVSPVGYSSVGPRFLKLTRSPLAETVISYLTPEFAVNYFVRMVYGDNSRMDPDVPRRYYHLLLREGNRPALIQVMNSLHDLEETHSPETHLNIKAPTLIMWGDKDRLLPVENASRFKEDIPDSVKIIYEGVGHIPMEEIPSETAREARNFLQSGK